MANKIVHIFYISLPPVVVRSIATTMSVRSSVGLFVCLLAYLKNHTSKFHEVFCTCCLWSWLGPSSYDDNGYVMYFWFRG